VSYDRLRGKWGQVAPIRSSRGLRPALRAASILPRSPLCRWISCEKPASPCACLLPWDRNAQRSRRPVKSTSSHIGTSRRPTAPEIAYPACFVRLPYGNRRLLCSTRFGVTCPLPPPMPKAWLSGFTLRNEGRSPALRVKHRTVAFNRHRDRPYSRQSVALAGDTSRLPLPIRNAYLFRFRDLANELTNSLVAVNAA
jgi:hypothetical protein